MFNYLRDLWLMPTRIAWIARRLEKACVRVRPRCYRIVPILGPVSRTAGPVAKTPQYYRFPLFGEKIMATTMTTIDQFTVTVQPVDAKGNPAPVENPEWLTNNTDVLSLVPSVDGMSCIVKAVGIPGAGTVQFSADADMGAGVTLIAGTLDVEVGPAQAVSVVLVPGPVEVQP